MDNAGDRKAIRRKEKEARQAERAREDVVRNLMSTMQGREFVWNILEDCRIFSSTFNGDALQSAFNEGRRSAGLALLAAIMQSCPDQYIAAQREANVRSTTDERRSSTQPNGRDSGPSDPDPDPDDDSGLHHDHGGYDEADRPSH